MHDKNKIANCSKWTKMLKVVKRGSLGLFWGDLSFQGYSFSLLVNSRFRGESSLSYGNFELGVLLISILGLEFQCFLASYIMQLIRPVFVFR